MIGAFAVGPEPPRLERLAFAATRFAPEHIEQLVESPVLDTFIDLAITDSWLGADDLRRLAGAPG